MLYMGHSVLGEKEIGSGGVDFCKAYINRLKKAYLCNRMEGDENQTHCRGRIDEPWLAKAQGGKGRTKS